jgi:NADP-dependent 3-hydroxy acid dehydrogenase YdfG
MNRLEALASEIEEKYDVSTLPISTDVSNEEDVEEMVKESVDTFGTLEIVVNNAGTATERDVGIQDLETDQYRAVMNINTDGMFFTAREALPHLIDSSGILIFVGSYAGQYPKPGSPVYAATKWWTRGFALSLAGQVGTEGVGVTVINPSEVRTEFGSEFRDEQEVPEAQYDPGEITEPEDVAQAIVFAAQQKQPNTISELNLYRRDKFSHF